ncbi:MAG: dienelactone hydrolase family protein [Pyrinomonadaceae bacterium]|nr:dienelactone hydrolase family protein [Pyrinomonadaceae bacterium]MBP6213323.1 dienelactone hydrolase family protein [Pyrinomonadaceae bacterium]
MSHRKLILLVFLTVVAFVLSVTAQADPLSQPGSFRPGWRSITVTRANNTTFTARLYYPATASGQNAPYDAAGAPYPAITFGHGFFQAVSSYQSTLEHLATHGYFVIASDSESGLFPSHQNFADDIKRCLTYLEQENANSASTLFAQVVTSKFGASGHSMGGGASILATAQDSRIKALANLAAAETNPSATAVMPAINVPVNLLSGSADTIVPVASNGQLMYNGGNTPKILPVIQGGWHCGFQDANGFGCDTGTITRGQQLAETRRMLTAFFNLYLKSDETAAKKVWGSELENTLVQAQRNSGIEISPQTQNVNAPVGVPTTFSVTITNRGSAAASYSVFVEQRRWIVITSPQQSAVLNPDQSAIITFRVRRLWKNSSLLNGHVVSIRSNTDNLTRSYANVTLR